VPLLRNPASRFSFIRSTAGEVSLFVDGRSHRCAGAAAAFAEALCARDRITVGDDVLRSDEAIAVIIDLLNQGSVAFEPTG
jgi:50S ribosomal protein L16 3-hydroxylase